MIKSIESIHEAFRDLSASVEGMAGEMPVHDRDKFLKVARPALAVLESVVIDLRRIADRMEGTL